MPHWTNLRRKIEKQRCLIKPSSFWLTVKKPCVMCSKCGHGRKWHAWQSREEGRGVLTGEEREWFTDSMIERGRTEWGMKEIPEWQCGPKGGNWEHMGQILQKLTEREHLKKKKIRPGDIKKCWCLASEEADLSYFPSSLVYFRGSPQVRAW